MEVIGGRDDYFVGVRNCFVLGSQLVFENFFPRGLRPLQPLISGEPHD